MFSNYIHYGKHDETINTFGSIHSKQLNEQSKLNFEKDDEINVYANTNLNNIQVNYEKIKDCRKDFWIVIP